VKRSKKNVAAVAVALTLVGGGVAYAYWSTGVGSAFGQTDDATPFDVVVTVDTTNKLSPNGAVQPITLTVTNPASAWATETLTSVTVRVANADGTTWNSGTTCDAQEFFIVDDGTGYYSSSGQTIYPGVALAPGASWSYPAAGGSLGIQMIDDGFNQEDCKGLQIPIFVETK